MIHLLNFLFGWKPSLKPLLLSILGVFLSTQLWAAPALATGIYSMPTLSAGDPTWVIDDAGVLSRLVEGNLSKQLAELADQTGYEVRYVTLHRFDYGETAESFVKGLFEKWFPTPEAQANQIVVLLDNVTNTSAIQVGEAAKALLPEDIAESVAQETLQVPLRQGDKYQQAFGDVTDRLVAVLSGEPDPGPPIVQDTINVEGTFTSAEDTDASSATLIVVVLLIAATIIPMVTYFWYVR
jgi:uncharacterized protein